MVFEYRANTDYFFGTLAAAASIADTTLQSTAFAGLSSAYATTLYLPLILHDPATLLREVVWVTAHVASSQTVTVVRGREGTSAKAWPIGTQVVCAPTAARDGLGVVASSALPTDAHIGYRSQLSDKGRVVEKTWSAGWQPSVGVAVPSDFGNRLDTTAIPDTAVLIMRGDRATGTTDANGRITANFKQPFPNQCLVAMATWISGTGVYVIAVYTHTASSVTVFFYNPNTGAVVGAGLNVTFAYLAVGY
jgi:hypothetical protein